MKGKAESLDCNALANGNIGCGVRTDSDRSFGPGFNKNGGGWYAVERTEGYIKVWFWSRKDGGVPKEVKDGVDGVSPDKWGKPTALFVSDSCPIKDKFGPNNIVINLGRQAVIGLETPSQVAWALGLCAPQRLYLSAFSDFFSFVCHAAARDQQAAE